MTHKAVMKLTARLPSPPGCLTMHPYLTGSTRQARGAHWRRAGAAARAFARPRARTAGCAGSQSRNQSTGERRNGPGEPFLGCPRSVGRGPDSARGRSPGAHTRSPQAPAAMRAPSSRSGPALRTTVKCRAPLYRTTTQTRSAGCTENGAYALYGLACRSLHNSPAGGWLCSRFKGR